MDLNSSENIILGISDVKDGPMKGDFNNQQSFFKRQNLDKRKIIGAGLVHGNRVVIIDNKTEQTMINDCDALITADKNCLLTVTVADCLPIYFYDSKKRVVALAHAGWKGVLNGIAKETALSLINNFNCNPADIKILIGPHIQKCHFEVKDDVASQFTPKYIIETGGKEYINLAAAVKDQLSKIGLLADNILIGSDCTFCLEDKYFSFRRKRDKIVKAMIAYIGLK
jgi:hypothetical protein